MNIFRQLLSNQQHYDWGLRALKTVIGFCGTILKASVALKSLSEECSVAVQALELNTTSKLTYDDGVLFKSLLSDIFPEVNKTTSPQLYDELTQKIRIAAEEMRLQINQRQVKRLFILKLLNVKQVLHIYKLFLGTKMYRTLRTITTTHGRCNYGSTINWKNHNNSTLIASNYIF